MPPQGSVCSRICAVPDTSRSRRWPGEGEETAPSVPGNPGNHLEKSCRFVCSGSCHKLFITQGRSPKLSGAAPEEKRYLAGTAGRLLPARPVGPRQPSTHCPRRPPAVAVPAGLAVPRISLPAKEESARPRPGWQFCWLLLSVKKTHRKFVSLLGLVINSKALGSHNVLKPSLLCLSLSNNPLS